MNNCRANLFWALAEEDDPVRAHFLLNVGRTCPGYQKVIAALKRKV